MGSIITLPVDALAQITGYIGGLFTDLWMIVALVIGLPLAFWAIRKVIGLFRLR